MDNCSGLKIANNQPTVSIEEVKRSMSTLLNRVANGNERIILTAHGKPKAVLIGIEDYTRLLSLEQQAKRAQWKTWLHRAEQLSHQVLADRDNESFDITKIIDDARADLEDRHSGVAQAANTKP